jgi:hypothetical protein
LSFGSGTTEDAYKVAGKYVDEIKIESNIH